MMGETVVKAMVVGLMFACIGAETFGHASPLYSSIVTGCFALLNLKSFFGEKNPNPPQ